LKSLGGVFKCLTRELDATQVFALLLVGSGCSVSVGSSLVLFRRFAV